MSSSLLTQILLLPFLLRLASAQVFSLYNNCPSPITVYSNLTFNFAYTVQPGSLYSDEVGLAEGVPVLLYTDANNGAKTGAGATSIGFFGDTATVRNLC